MKLKLYEENPSFFSASEYSSMDLNSNLMVAQKLHLTRPMTDCQQEGMRLVLILDGNCTIAINGTNFLGEKGTFCCFLPYHIFTIAPLDQKVTLYHCQFSLGLVMSFSLTGGMKGNSRYEFEFGSPVQKLAHWAEVEGDFSFILKMVEKKEDFCEMLCLATLMRLVYRFKQLAVKNFENNAGARRGLSWELLQYIQIHFAKALTTVELGRIFNSNPEEINRTLRHLTGENFSQTLHRTRIRNVCAMIIFDELSLNYIGRYVGYPNDAAFYRSFAKIMGRTPHDYRTAQKSKTTVHSQNFTYTILSYIFDHYQENITLETASMALFCSAYTIRTALNDQFKENFSDLTKQIRLRYATHLLSVVQNPIVDVAFGVGFDSLRSFERAFLQELGTTPDAYRKEYALK